MNFKAEIIKNGEVMAHNAEVFIGEKLIEFVWNNDRSSFERKINKDKDLVLCKDGIKCQEFFIIFLNKEDEKRIRRIMESMSVKVDNTISGATISGSIYGNVSNASSIYGMDKFSTPRGHGFAAEQANHLYDKVTNGDFFGQGKVKLVGDDIDPTTGRIIKNGADRVVNGTNIQTKYCSTGGKCISECFENGKFRYLNADGTPMQVEVPSDKYDAAIQAMENRIKKGEIPGVTDPEDAKKIVRKGHFTYEQAKNIAKAGTVESITFDAVNGAIIATSAFGISTVLSFATSVWNGDDFDIAIKNATYTGLKVGGTTFITAVLAGQLSKAGLNSALVGSSEAIVSIMGPKASAMLVNAFRSGTNIYGAAAMKSAAKMLRGNAITGAVSVVVLSSVDVVNIFRGRISGKQLFKNVANTASTVAGGTAGWVGGATAGAAIGSAVPIIGTAVGGLVGGVIGSFAGGAASSKVSNTVLGAFIEDDAEEMVRIIENVFQGLAVDYLLNQKEAENVVDLLKDDLSGGTLKDMYASSNRDAFAKTLIIEHIENEVKKRKKIVMPSEEVMRNGLRAVLEEMADAEDKKGEEMFFVKTNNKTEDNKKKKRICGNCVFLDVIDENKDKCEKFGKKGDLYDKPACQWFRNLEDRKKEGCCYACEWFVDGFLGQKCKLSGQKRHEDDKPCEYYE